MDLLTAARVSFPRDYAESRRRFLRAAKARGAEIRSYVNPNRGPDGGRLATDCAWLGPRNAKNLLVLMSGTHGVEGFCGAGALMDLLAAPPKLPRGLALLLIHAINPFGFAWIRRVTEDGVDLNRNFVDFAKPPANSGYDALADAILPKKLSGPVYERAQKKLRAYIAKHGMPAFNVAMSGGQYRHPNGLFFGGTKPTWSHRTQAAIIADYALKRRRRIAVIDYHTGLGPHGYGDLLCAHMPNQVGRAGAQALRRQFERALRRQDQCRTGRAGRAPRFREPALGAKARRPRGLRRHRIRHLRQPRRRAPRARRRPLAAREGAGALEGCANAQDQGAAPQSLLSRHRRLARSCALAQPPIDPAGDGGISEGLIGVPGASR